MPSRETEGTEVTEALDQVLEQCGPHATKGYTGPPGTHLVEKITNNRKVGGGLEGRARAPPTARTCGAVRTRTRPQTVAAPQREIPSGIRISLAQSPRFERHETREQTAKGLCIFFLEENSTHKSC